MAEMLDMTMRIDVPFKDLDKFYHEMTNQKWWQNGGVKDFVVSKELGKESKKEHIHLYLYQSSEFKRSTLSDFMMKQKFYKPKCYSYVPVSKTVEGYLLYILKDLDIYKTNMDEDRIDYLIEKTQEINEQKKLQMKDKILRAVLSKLPPNPHEEKIGFQDDYKKIIIQTIIEVYKATGKLFPNKSQIQQYTYYCMAHIGGDSEAELETIFLKAVL